jgi:hypothetical protein
MAALSSLVFARAPEMNVDASIGPHGTEKALIQSPAMDMDMVDVTHTAEI